MASIARQALLFPLHWRPHVPPALRELDLDRIILGHVLLTLLASLSVSPSYNFALSLFGLYAINNLLTTSSPSALSAFSALFLFSVPLDLIWLWAWWNDTRTRIILLVLLNAALKLVTLSGTANAMAQAGLEDRTWGAPSNLPGGWPGARQDDAAYDRAEDGYANIPGQFGFSSVAPGASANGVPAHRPSSLYSVGGYQSIGGDYDQDAQEVGADPKIPTSFPSASSAGLAPAAPGRGEARS